ncbi:MOSC domain-containing protein [Nocardioides mangrovi]|uniref:MOSC domain-containing protein n=1 Tax=Nocardioides mangrovi TaxID=2874580 RepID=A0ABS7U7R5_9ACTN|nr:MOSC domain-containing protein [Nocardioides mangrovi]MBZ5736707.1 MOSC domain-containing protein [Nocardioides mangrovi]
MATVLSVNVGTPRPVVLGRTRTSSIEKHPVAGPVAVGALGLDGDRVSNTKHHGGLDKAVYAFAREDLDHWERELGREIRDGLFGENLTTRGIDVNAAEIGERWRIGDAVLEVSSVRTPCRVFQAWLKQDGFDTTSWARRFTAAGRPGPYLRVVEEGVIEAGDTVEVVHRPGHGLTVSGLFAAVTGGADGTNLTLATRELPT